MFRSLLALFAVLILTIPAHAADAIKVGGLFADSGPAAVVGTPSRLVAQMAVEEINAAGGILGRPLELVLFDTETDANLALRGARTLDEQDGVFAIVGPTTTKAGMVVKTYTEKAGVPAIMTVGGDPIVLGGKFGPYDWTFKVPQRTFTAVTKIADYLVTQDVKTVAVLYANDSFGKDGLRNIEEIAPGKGLSIVATEAMDTKGTDFSAQAFKLAMARPDAIIVWTIGPAGAIATRNIRDMPGDRPLIVQCHGQPGPKFVELAGAAAEGVVMPGTKLLVADELDDADPQKPLLLRFIADYTERGLNDAYPLNTHSGYAYDALLLLKKGLEKAGTVDRKAFRDAMQTLTGVVGISGIFSLTPEDHNGLDTDSMVMLKVQDGTYAIAQ